MKGYKFICNECGKETTSNYCIIGETVHCKICNKLITIPENATSINDSDTAIIANQTVNSENFTIQLLKGFAFFDLILGFIIAIYIFFECGIFEPHDSNRLNFFTLTIIISFILQGIFAYALCNSLSIIVENIININKLLKQKK